MRPDVMQVVKSTQRDLYYRFIQEKITVFAYILALFFPPYNLFGIISQSEI